MDGAAATAVGRGLGTAPLDAVAAPVQFASSALPVLAAGAGTSLHHWFVLVRRSRGSLGERGEGEESGGEGELHFGGNG